MIICFGDNYEEIVLLIFLLVILGVEMVTYTFEVNNVYYL